MSRPLRTPLKAAHGLGAAKEGVDHFIKQRVTAVALLILVPWFAVAFVTATRAGYDAARAFVAGPVTAVLMVLTVSAAFYHMRLGLQVVVEDYIHRASTKAILLIANTFVAAALWAAAVFSILKVALG